MWNNIEVCHQTQRVSRDIGKSGLLCCGPVSSDRDSDPSVQRACNFQPHPHTSIPKDCGVKEKKNLHEEKRTIHPHTRESDISPLQGWPEGLHRMSRRAAKSTVQTPEG